MHILQENVIDIHSWTHKNQVKEISILCYF